MSNKEVNREWDAIARQLRELPSVKVPAGLADRAFRAAVIAHENEVGFVERFLFAARRTVVFGTVTAALVWAVLLFNNNSATATYDPSTLPWDLQEQGVALWVTEETR